MSPSQRFRLVACATLAAVGLSATASAQEPPVRPEKRESDAYPPASVRLPTVLGGLGLTAGFWAMGYGSAALSSDDVAYLKLRTPVIGPFQALHVQACPTSGCSFTTYFSYVYFGIQALAQVGGLGIAVTGLAIPTSNSPRTVTPAKSPGTTPAGPRTPSAPDTPAEDKPAPNKGPMFFLPQPIVMGKDGAGIGVFGVFLCRRS